jgi:hypothetical protein
LSVGWSFDFNEKEKKNRNSKRSYPSNVGCLFEFLPPHKKLKILNFKNNFKNN